MRLKRPLELTNTFNPNSPLNPLFFISNPFEPHAKRQALSDGTVSETDENSSLSSQNEAIAITYELLNEAIHIAKIGFNTYLQTRGQAIENRLIQKIASQLLETFLNIPTVAQSKEKVDGFVTATTSQAYIRLSRLTDAAYDSLSHIACAAEKALFVQTVPPEIIQYTSRLHSHVFENKTALIGKHEEGTLKPIVHLWSVHQYNENDTNPAYPIAEKVFELMVVLFENDFLSKAKRTVDLLAPWDNWITTKYPSPLNPRREDFMLARMTYQLLEQGQLPTLPQRSRISTESVEPKLEKTFLKRHTHRAQWDRMKSMPS